jgi:hypothetical protein
MDDRAYDLWGMPRIEHVKFEDLFAHIHPADRNRAQRAAARRLAEDQKRCCNWCRPRPFHRALQIGPGSLSHQSQ